MGSASFHQMVLLHLRNSFTRNQLQLQPFSTRCPLKSHTYLNKSAAAGLFKYVLPLVAPGTRGLKLDVVASGTLKSKLYQFPREANFYRVTS